MMYLSRMLRLGLFICLFSTLFHVSAAPTAEQQEKINTALNQLLADYAIFTQNVRSLHWQIKGPNFFELHAKYESLYNSLLEKTDDLAERIIAMQGKPFTTYEEFIKNAHLKSDGGISEDKQGVSLVIASLKFLVESQKTLIKMAASYGDEGSVEIIRDYIPEQEKLIWMYSAFLK